MFLALSLTSCSEKIEKPDEERNVMVMMAMGYNSLSGWIKDDIQDLMTGYLPKKKTGENVLLVFSKTTSASGSYSFQTSPSLIRIYEEGGKAQSEVIKTWDNGTVAASAEMVREVLTYVRDNYKAKSYGVVMSSHASGWLPEDYYKHPGSYENLPVSTSPYTFGSETNPSDIHKVDYEIEIEDLASAIPMHLDYMLFDACLMGGIETAYALRDVTTYIGFSQAEVMAEGFNYKTITTHLLKDKNPQPYGVCADFYKYYSDLPLTVGGATNLERSATISLVNTEKLDELADVCKPLFEKYRKQIREINDSEVQGFGGRKNFYFDIVDIVRCAGATSIEVANLQMAVDNVIYYRNTTGQYYSVTDYMAHKIDIGKFSGLSMYLPAAGNPYLDNYYKTLSWNQASALVK